MCHFLAIYTIQVVDSGIFEPLKFFFLTWNCVLVSCPSQQAKKSIFSIVYIYTYLRARKYYFVLRDLMSIIFHLHVAPFISYNSCIVGSFIPQSIKKLKTTAEHRKKYKSIRHKSPAKDLEIFRLWARKFNKLPN